MLAAEPNDLAFDRHHFDADDIVGREPVFQAMHAARILGDIAADRAGDLARRIGRIIEPLPLHGVRDPEIGHARLSDDAAIVESISRILLNLPVATRTPSASGKAPPESDVPAPRGTTLILFAAQ